MGYRETAHKEYQVNPKKDEHGNVCRDLDGFIIHDPNPVHKNDDGKWWFWDETWCREYGGFDTKEECEATLKQYCIEFLGIEEEQFKTEG
jgi:hypothetical protein